MTASSMIDPATVPAAPVVELDRAQVLDAAGDCVFGQLRAEADLLEVAVRWADVNPVTDESPCAADWWDGEGVPVPGQIPEVAAPAIVEFAARIGRSTGAGKWVIFEALQLRHRMPRTWRLVQQLRMPAYRARQLVMVCYRLNDVAVDWLDRQMASVAGQVGPTQVDRMVARAASEFDPEFVVERRRKRYVHIDPHDRNAGIDGSGVHACVDPWDAVDLDAALNAGAEARKQWGSTADRDGRRAEALGDLARLRLGQAVLPLDPDDADRDGADRDGSTGGSTGDGGRAGAAGSGADGGPGSGTDGDAGHRADHAANRSTTGGVPPLVSHPRELTMYVHLSDQALRAGRPESAGDEADRAWLAECGTLNKAITADLVRDWCGNPELTVNVKHVIDLRQPIVTDTYRPTPRQREHVALADPTCGFAHCTRPIHPVPTRRKPDGTLDDSWDADHTKAWQPGDTTSTDGLVGLCRHHHRGKTLHGWRYRPIADGIIVWRSPYGYDYLRTPTGTTDLGRHRPADGGTLRGRGGPGWIPGWLQTTPLQPPPDDEPPPDPLDGDLGPPSDADLQSSRNLLSELDLLGGASLSADPGAQFDTG